MKIVVKSSSFVIINIVKVPEAAQMLTKTTFRIQLFVVVTTFIVLLSTLSPHSVNASISRAFTYQGKIVNTAGTNLKTTDAACISTSGADTCDFRVSIYTLSSGGTLVWQQTISNVEIYDNDGIFNLLLDCGGTFASCNQNGGPNFASGQLFIQVEFDPSGNGDFAEGETFNPRRQLTAAPYAFNAESADTATTLSGIAASSFLRSDADDSLDINRVLTTNGTLDTEGDIIIKDTNVALTGTATKFSFTGDFTINTKDLFVNKTSGFVGVNNTTPSVAFDVTGSVKSTGNLEVQGFASIGGGTAPNANSGLIINLNKTFTNVGQQLLIQGTTTAAANQNVYGMRLEPLSITIPSGTTNLASSLYVNEPNITNSGTLTNTAGIYIASAATEGINNYSLWIDSGAVRIDDSLTIAGDFILNGTIPSNSNVYIGSNGSAVFNEQGKDSDFRIDGSGPTVNTALFFADANTQSIGVHTSLPTAFFDLPGGALTAATMRIRAGTSPSVANPGDIFYDGTGLYFRNGNVWKDLTAGTTLQSSYDGVGGQTIATSSTKGALTFDLVSANFDVVVGQGASTGDYRVWDGGNTWFFVDESANAVSVGNNAASSTLSLSSNSWGISTTGAVSGVTTLNTKDDWMWTGTTPTINIVPNEVFKIVAGAQSLTYDSTDSSLAVTDGTNSVDFDLDTGPLFSGTARPVKQIVLSPEYPGAVLTAFNGASSDTLISGTMIAKADTAPATSMKSYYQWTRASATEHFYTVAVRVTLPPDFSAWATNNAMVVNYQTSTAVAGTSLVDVRVYLEGNATVENSSVNQVSTGWNSVAYTGASFNLWNTAGQTAVIYLRMGAQNGATSKVGDIVLNYLGKY